MRIVFSSFFVALARSFVIQKIGRKNTKKINTFDEKVSTSYKHYRKPALALRYREFTTAKFLVVEAIFVDNFDSSLTQTTPSPVLIPENYIGKLGFCKTSRLLDLLETFPPARGQSGGQNFNAMLMGITRRTQQPVFETLKTTFSPLRLAFQTSHLLPPIFMVVIVVNNLQTKRLGIARAFVFSYLIFLQRKNIGIAVIDNRRNAMLHQAFDDGRRTRRTASVQKHLFLPSGDLYLKLLFHGLKVIKMTAITAVTSPR